MKENNSNYKRKNMLDAPPQRYGGQITPYDKMLIDMLGTEWMKEAKQHFSSKSWIKQSRPHIGNYIAKLGIPPNPLTKTDNTHSETQGNDHHRNNNTTQPSLLRQLTPHQNRPEQDNDNPDGSDSGSTEGMEEEWKPNEENAQCIQIIVDNQTLADIINGDAILKNSKLIPIISRIMDRLEPWMNNGWNTPTAVHPIRQL